MRVHLFWRIILRHIVQQNIFFQNLSANIPVMAKAVAAEKKMTDKFISKRQL